MFVYYCLSDSKVYRTPKGAFLGKKELYRDGGWIYDGDAERDLNDALMDYGDFSITDVKKVTEAEAFALIKA